MPVSQIAKSAFSRVFLIEGRARPDHEPDFQSCMKGGTLDQSFGDIERVECPDPARYGGFVEVTSIQGAVDRATSSLVGRYASDLASELLRLAKLRCATDVHLHFGECTDPRVFNRFTKAVIMEDVFLTTWASDELGALSSDENAVVNETSDLSIREFYEVLELTFQSRAGDTVMNEVVDVVICDSPSCGECEEESDGCQDIYALQGALTGSPGTAPDIIYSLNKGLTWALNEINTLTAAQAANALACLDDFIVVVSNDDNALHYKTKANVDAGTVGGWTENGTGFVVGGEPNDIWSVGTYAFVVGDGGYVYGTSDPAAGVTVLDAGVATNAILYAVHAISDEFAVAVGAGDAIVWTRNRVNWSVATATGGGGDLQGVWIKNEDEWFVVDDDGNMWYTLDGGDSWTEKVLPGTSDILHDIAMATDSVMYVCGSANTTGTAWRSYNGGYDWVALPEGIGNLPTARDLNALAACVWDANFLVLVGEGAAANDGIIIVGED